MVVQVLSWGVKRQKSEASHSYLSNAEVKNYHNPQGSHLVEMRRRGKCVCKSVKMYDK